MTEGETLSCADPASWDRVKRGRFFQFEKLGELGEIYLHKLHPSYQEGGRERGVANEISVGEDVQAGRRSIIYVTRPFKDKGFEFYRDERDGYSPLLVLRNSRGVLLGGGYVPLQSIKQSDGTILYRSGSYSTFGSFFFPQYPLPIVFSLQAIYYPDKIKKRTGDISLRIWGVRPNSREISGELFNGKAAFGEMVRAGNYLLSMDEVRFWTSIKVIYRPGQPLIIGSFWITFGGLILNLVVKTAKRRGEEGTAA